MATETVKGIKVFKDENGIQQTEEYTYEREIVNPRTYEIPERLQEIRAELQAIDIKRFKFIDGNITEAEYEPFKQEANALRAEYNALEVELASL